MLISLSDPGDQAVLGELFNADLIPNSVRQGQQFNLFFSSTGSDSNDVLFDLSDPPTFFGPHMVWGEVDRDGTLNLFLSPTTGDSAHPFAQLRGFASFESGTGDLTRNNKLPPQVDWALAQ